MVAPQLRLPDGPPREGISSVIFVVASVPLTRSRVTMVGEAISLARLLLDAPPPPASLFLALTSTPLKQSPSQTLLQTQSGHCAFGCLSPPPNCFLRSLRQGPRLLLVLFSRIQCFFLQ